MTLFSGQRRDVPDSSAVRDRGTVPHPGGRQLFTLERRMRPAGGSLRGCWRIWGPFRDCSRAASSVGRGRWWRSSCRRNGVGCTRRG